MEGIVVPLIVREWIGIISLPAQPSQSKTPANMISSFLLAALVVGGTGLGIWAAVEGTDEVKEHGDEWKAKAKEKWDKATDKMDEKYLGFFDEIQESSLEFQEWWADKFDKRSDEEAEAWQNFGQRDSNAAVWLHGDSLSAEEMRLLKSLRIDPDEPEAHKAKFTLGDEKRWYESTGSFFALGVRLSFPISSYAVLTKKSKTNLATQSDPIDGVMHGNFSTTFATVPFPLEGTWITVNTTEASDKTTTHFEQLRNALYSNGTDAEDRQKLFENLLDAATAAQKAEEKAKKIAIANGATSVAPWAWVPTEKAEKVAIANGATTVTPEAWVPTQKSVVTVHEAPPVGTKPVVYVYDD